jgi:site-specific DNA-methyltransferase (adenine-specific)
MSAQAGFALRGRNPDVLTCIANLSNDEVFTPPEFANRMLDKLAEAWAAGNGGADIWADRTVRFLDPCTKSGVLLREIASRLIRGLAGEIPNLEERVNHVLTKQVFGIGITYLTSLLARRSVYCSKHAKGGHSIAKTFASDDGNIWFKRLEHSWVDGRCKYCGASKHTLDRGEGFETHAYPFIHTDNIKTRVAELFGGDMQFDVIIGNPPYQMTGGGGGTNDSPIYDLFVRQAMRLEPRFLSMVIPSRWMAGGRGLGEFRAEVLGDRRVRTLVDYENAKDVFPTVGIGGGICYFLWDRENPGLCECV